MSGTVASGPLRSIPGPPGHRAWNRVRRITREEYDRRITESGTIPLGRGAESADIAAAVVYLASDDARRVNGIEYNIDGGSSAQ